LEKELDHIRRRLREEGEKTLAFFAPLLAVGQQVYQTGSRGTCTRFWRTLFQQKYKSTCRMSKQGSQYLDLDIDTFNGKPLLAYTQNCSDDAGCSPDRLADTLTG
jgi:hypothetical protein